MRAFIALELSEEIKLELARLEGKLKKVDTDIKWTKPENAHLTLKFLGEIDESKAEEVKSGLDKISASQKPFEMSLFKLGAFPSMDHMRVIWVGTDKGCSEVEKLASLVEEVAEKCGFFREDRPFNAHLTLGRVKSAKNKEALKKKLLTLDVKPVSCTIKSIVLFQSTLHPTGPIHTPIYKADFIET